MEGREGHGQARVWHRVARVSHGRASPGKECRRTARFKLAGTADWVPEGVAVGSGIVRDVSAPAHVTAMWHCSVIVWFCKMCVGFNGEPDAF